MASKKLYIRTESDDLVIPNIPDGITLLTPDEDRQLREQLDDNFPKILSKFLNSVTKEKNYGKCTSTLLINDAIETYDFSKNPAVLVKYDDSIIDPSFDAFKSRIDKLIADIESCESDIFYIPLDLIPLLVLADKDHEPPEDYLNVGHQNLLIFYKKIKKLLWIEPQGLNFKVGHYAKLAKYLNNNLADRLGVTPSSFYVPSINCLQKITNDTNCMFWTFLVVTLLVINKTDKVKYILSKFQKEVPADQLEKYIEKFKAFMAGKTEPVVETGGSRKWAISTAKRNKFQFKLHRYTKKSRISKRGKRALKN